MTNTTAARKSEKLPFLTGKTYTQGEKNKIYEKLITARVALLLKHPFFGNMATRMKLIDASDWCSTLATDGRNFYYNNEFVDKLTPKSTEFGFAHEVLHNVFDHIGRFNGRDPQLSNIAADYATNQILKDEKIGEAPNFLKIYQNNKYRGWSFEKIYDDLEQNCTKINLSQLGQLLDEHLDGNDDGDMHPNRPVLTEEEKKKIREEIKEAMIAASQSAGNLPEGIKRLIGDFTEPKMDWRQILRMNIQSIVRSNYTFSRPNRKSQHCGAILPGMTQEETIDICVSFDMSGSISNAMARDMLSEVKGIIDEYTDYKLRLWSFDTSVYGYREFTSDNGDEIMDYVPKGGGGTAFEANWSFMKNNEIEPKKFILFTDGYPNSSWGDPDYADTIFVIHGNKSIVAPFGQTLYYES
jgi:predicted metal-dependent peptidase